MYSFASFRSPISAPPVLSHALRNRIETGEISWNKNGLHNNTLLGQKKSCDLVQFSVMTFFSSLQYYSWGFLHSVYLSFLVVIMISDIGMSEEDKKGRQKLIKNALKSRSSIFGITASRNSGARNKLLTFWKSALFEGTGPRSSSYPPKKCHINDGWRKQRLLKW